MTQRHSTTAWTTAPLDSASAGRDPHPTATADPVYDERLVAHSDPLSGVLPARCPLEHRSIAETTLGIAMACEAF